MSDQQHAADTAEVNSLIHTALYDTGGETVEGAFVDRWEVYALTAIDELKEIFQRRGFTSADEELLRQGVCEPGAPTEAAATLLRCLQLYALPLLESLEASDSPEGRAAALRALSEIRPPKKPQAGLNDPSPLVRLAALRGLIAGSSRANTQLIHALDDPDPEVRRVAAEHVGFVRQPKGAAALLKRFEVEETREVRDAILSNIVETVRREGMERRSRDHRKDVGVPIQSFLLAQMARHLDPKMRYEVARALERLECPEVGRAFLRRLGEETDNFPRGGLLYYPNFQEIEDEAFPVLTRLLSDPSASVRTGAAFALESFGERAIPHLMRTLDDPEEHIRRAAAMSLGKCKAWVALPRLLQELWKERQDWRWSRDFESAVRDVSCYVPGPPPGAPDAELSAKIQARIDSINAPHPGAWPQRVCREELNALPLFGTQIYMWCLRPDGTLLCWDHEAVRRDEGPETRPRYQFAIMVRGSIEYPELSPLIPKRPDNVRLCDHCKGRGWYTTNESPKLSCMWCDYLGWMERQ